MSKKWNDEDNKYLIDNYKSLSKDDLTIKFGRKIQAIRKHYCDLINDKYVKLKTIKLICPRCYEKVGEVKSKVSFGDRKDRNICKKCRDIVLEKMRIRENSEERKEFNSQRMQENNPMWNSKTVDKVLKTLRRERRKPRKPWKKHIKMMRNYQAANSPDAQKKSKQTRINNLKSGKTFYPKGVNHGNWKGNREFRMVVRSQLYPVWTVPIIIRDNRKCTMCGCNNGKLLHVHHIRPLRDIMKLVKERYNIKTFLDIDPNLWQPYINEVISEHKLSDGITVCRTCHSSIDTYYRLKNENKKNMDGTI